MRIVDSVTLIQLGFGSSLSAHKLAVKAINAMYYDAYGPERAGFITGAEGESRTPNEDTLLEKLAARLSNSYRYCGEPLLVHCGQKSYIFGSCDEYGSAAVFDRYIDPEDSWTLPLGGGSR